ncbi:hypothetical protein L2091_14865 [Curtobacterium albidum]|jgi:hypothetical protein|uniref:CdiI immunity protein domain-containing protein n=1 Tax=Curtobacterium citri TaxID=3055139 RepID=A0ABT7T906_9MICO|nr:MULTISPECIES: hypothetical protein [Curtobacterium]MCL9666508.1 hypothetical protein [Curtobacterium albidum]MDM7886061.1 hypothetical protein [Curtobacterium citri]
MDDEDFYREVIRRAPRTTSLLGVEFNLDWQLDWPDAESVLVQDLDDAPLRDNEVLQTELDYLLNVLGTDSSVDDFFTYIDSGLDPLAETGQTSRTWLIGLRDRAARNVRNGDSVERGQTGEVL